MRVGPGMAAHTFSRRTQEAEAGGALTVKGQVGLYNFKAARTKLRDPLSKNKLYYKTIFKKL